MACAGAAFSPQKRIAVRPLEKGIGVRPETKTGTGIPEEGQGRKSVSFLKGTATAREKQARERGSELRRPQHLHRRKDNTSIFK